MPAGSLSTNGREIPWAWRAGLLVAAVLPAAGWILSALGWLRPWAWGAVGVLLAAGLARWIIPRAGPAGSWRMLPPAWRRRQGPYLGFLVLAILALVGGLLYAPNNIDALGYRTPRVLHWLAEGRWHWIECPYNRLNTRATGFEWLTAPVVALTGSDRFLFLWNWGCFLALPGLTFSLLRQLGISGRTAWLWRWLAPSAYCFALQAGSIANDLYGAACGAAALALALRARRTHELSATLYSGLALALATGAKLSNLPLALPWLAAVWPALATLRRRPVRSAAAVTLAALASILPVALLNHRHCGDWTGAKAEYAWTLPPGPVAAVLHNAGLLTVQNLLPPVIPNARPFNAAVERRLPEAWKRQLDTFAEKGRQAYSVWEIPGEEHAGVGFGVSWLLLAGAAGGLLHRLRRPVVSRPRVRWRPESLVVLAGFVSLGPYLTRSAINTAGRLLAPYFPFVLPGLLRLADVPPAHRFWRRPAGRRLAVGVQALAALLVVLSPSRPLWPAVTVLERLQAAAPSPRWERAATVYQTYRQRPESLQPLLDRLPPGVRSLGWITGADAETSLWKPYGSRRVWHVRPGHRRADLDARGIRWILANVGEFENAVGRPMEVWLREMGARVVTRERLRLLAAQPPVEFAILELPAAPR